MAYRWRDNFRPVHVLAALLPNVPVVRAAEHIAVNGDHCDLVSNTSLSETFNLSDLVLIIGYKITAYIGGATTTQTVEDWLQNGLPADLEPRMRAAFDVAAPIAEVESELIAQAFLIGQWQETGSYRAPARMLRDRFLGKITVVFTGGRRDLNYHGWLYPPFFGRAKFTDGTLVAFEPEADLAAGKLGFETVWALNQRELAGSNIPDFVDQSEDKHEEISTENESGNAEVERPEPVEAGEASGVPRG